MTKKIEFKAWAGRTLMTRHDMTANWCGRRDEYVIGPFRLARGPEKTWNYLDWPPRKVKITIEFEGVK